MKSINVYQNLAGGAPATSGGTLNNADVVTNGDVWPDSGAGADREFAYTSQTGLQYVQIDLGAVYTVDKVRVWHYNADGRTYHSTKTQVSSDGSAWYTVFDSAVSGEYAETATGKTTTFTPRSVRYVRDYTNGSTANSGNHWVEIEAWGSTTTTYIGSYFEWSGSSNTMVKYYYAGGTRVTMRKGSVLNYLLTDHLGSTSVMADNVTGHKLVEQRYKAWGEARSTAITTLLTTFQYTGQRIETGIGNLYYYGAR